MQIKSVGGSMWLRTLILALVAGSWALIGFEVLATQPTTIHYQGQLLEEGAPFDGDAEFKLVFFSDGESIWSNDGTSSSGEEPASAVTIPVASGIFDMQIGSSPMQPLDPSVFAGHSAPQLRIWVDTGDGFEQLTDQPLSSVPFAFQAAAADSARAGGDGDGIWMRDGNSIYYNDGYVGIGTDSPQAKLHLDWSGNPNDGIFFGKNGGPNGTLLRSSGSNAQEFTVDLDPNDASGYERFMVRVNGSLTRFVIDSNGDVGIGTEAPEDRLHVAGTVRAEGGIRFGDGSLQGTAASGGLWVPEGSAASYWGDVFVGGGPQYADSDVEGMRIRGLSKDWRIGVLNAQTPEASDFYISANSAGDGTFHIEGGTGRVGINTTSPNAHLDVDGTIRGSVVEITGGSDLAEPFEIDGHDPEPGSVVVIDPEVAGKLKPSHSPYDTKVAGIVSGANGIRPGLSLRQEGTVADGDHPVALAGRVWCWCVTESGPIRPGDRLTTSSRSGHAMKAAEASRAPGTVIGKAMTNLDEGRGLVLVLVQPQ